MSDRAWFERLTPAQREAAGAGDRDLWLTAGAGSGKTMVLAARYLHLHIERNVPVRKLLAITFTEKAAAEMRERIGETLRRIGRHDACRAIPHAPILTIDSLCYRLVREFGDVAGIEPSVGVYDPVVARERKEEVWAALLDRWWRERKEDAIALFRAFRWTIDPEKPGGVDPSPFFSLVRAIRTAGRPLDEVPFLPDLAAERREIASLLESLFPEIERLLGEKVAEGTKERLRAIGTLRGGPSGPPGAEAYRTVRAALGRSVSAAAREVVSRARELLDRRIALDGEEALGRPRTLLRDLALDFERAFRAEKEREGKSDFLDLEEAALRILEEEEVVRAVRRRFRYLLLDECQDTNELQLRIVARLRSAGRFLAVGDAKQSIYAFRDADVTAFLAMDRRLGDRARRIDLDRSFRSRPEILRFVNLLFPRLWEENERMGVPYLPLLPAGGGRFEAKREPSIEFVRARAEGIGEARRLEAALLAERLRAIHDGRLDRIAYGDMALLFRSTTDIARYERLLRRRGIPAAVAVGRGFFQTREVTDLLGALKLVEDPFDDLRMAASLRSPLAGLGDDDLAALLAGAREESVSLWERLARLDEVLSLSGEGRARAARFAALLAELRGRRGRVASHRLLASLAEETGYLDALALLPGGLRRRANVRKLFGLAHRVEKEGDLPPSACIRALERFRTTRLREAESAIDAERDAVRLLTIHGAKGMEFPLVALVDLGRRRPGGAPPFLYDKKMGVGVRLCREGDVRRGDPWLYGKIRREREARLAAEETRLLYVALTRAERHLILSAAETGSPGGWLGRIAGAVDIPEEAGEAEIEGVAVRVVTGEVPPPAPAAPDPAALARDPERYGKEADRKEVEKILARIDAPPPPPSLDRAGRTVTGVVTFAGCPRRFRLTRLFPLSPPPGAEGARSVSLGSRFHRFMEFFWRGREREAAALARGAPDLLRWRDRFLALPEARPFLAADLREPELSFCVPAEGRPLRGAVDLLARTAEGWAVIDYKTDRATAGEILGRYRLALSLYRLALRVLTGMNAPVEAWIYAAREGRFLPVPAGEEEARAALGRYDRAEEEGAYEPSRSGLCGTCLYRRGCAAVGDGGEG